jgi:CheY-like chemotaxis protein
MTAARCRVLLIEDEFLVGMLIGDMLADLGHELAARADCLDDALELARSAAFDLGLLDLTLRGITTYRVADLLKERGLPFAFVTGRHAVEIDPGYADVPALQKPFRLDDLAATIAQLIK